MKQNKTFKVFAIVFTVLLMVFSLAAELSAQPPQKRLIRRGLPDLVVKDIRLVKGCQILVTVANVGKRGVPASYYNLPKAVGVQMYKDGNPWGGLILSGFDPNGNLKKPGGVARHLWFPKAANLKLTPGVHSIKVTVDHGKVLKEARENNNSLTRRVKCGGGSIGTPAPGMSGLTRFAIKDIRFSPASPAALNFDEDVKVKFRYWSPVDKVHIFARPMTNGKPTPNYAAHGSKPLPKAKGKISSGYFTIKKGKVTVDAVRFQIKNKAQTKVLYEKTVRVKYTFPKLSVAPGLSTTIATPAVATAVLAKAPQRFFLDFKDAYLAFKTTTKSIQIIAESNVLSYGGDWEKCQLKPFLFHIRHKVWKGFYWKINTSRKEVYKVTGGTFCKLGGSEQKLPFTVKTNGDFCYIYLTKAYLVYVPSSKSLQVVAQLMALSYGNDWQKCNKSANIYHLRENFWKGFYWMVDTFKKKVYRVKGGTFCGSGGSSQALGATTVRVVK